MCKAFDNVKDGRKMMRMIAEKDEFRTATLWKLSFYGDLERVIDTVSL